MRVYTYARYALIDRPGRQGGRDPASRPGSMFVQLVNLCSLQCLEQLELNTELRAKVLGGAAARS